MRSNAHRARTACLALLMVGCADLDAREAPGPLSRVDAGVDAPPVDPLASWRLPSADACGDAPLLSLRERGPRTTPDWSEHAKVPITGRANRYGLPENEYLAYVRKGRRHTVKYPVTVTAWLPQKLMERVFSEDDNQDVISLIKASGNPLAVFDDLRDFERWLGLVPFPNCDEGGAQSVPYPIEGVKPNFAMGSTRLVDADGEKVNYSCASCHASRLFGRSILGLQNRTSHANVGIDKARVALQDLPFNLLRLLYPMTDGEARTLTRLQEALRYVNIVAPVTRGLDTSLTQVALSLAKRAQDDYATRDPNQAPRPDRLETFPADTKPGNWWVLKYKNRWLLDGSVVSGNPLYTNVLWNEIGRGTDLHELEGWLDANQAIIDEVTAAVFASEPVRMTEFFAPESFDIEAAKRGKPLFDQACASCHGTYKKGWELPQAASLPLADRLATAEVRYHEDTPVYDVGTDNLRNLAMTSMLPLNQLAVSIKSGTLIKVQSGYVPPPLVGIWARYPYFHNNSAPSLCAVLTRGADRPRTYHSGPQDNTARDFDRECNGYPRGDAVPRAWLEDPEALYDTTRMGLGNQGHDEGVFLKSGVELFTERQKRDIIAFLQTL